MNQTFEQIPDMSVRISAPVIPLRSEKRKARSSLQGIFAPEPLIDKYPSIVGSGLSLSYLSAAYRQSLTGYRRTFVDALSELLERDPHLYAVVMQRVLTAAGARIVIQPRDPQSARCRTLAKNVQKIIDNIENFRQSVSTLIFSGLFYGLGGNEILWDVDYNVIKRRQTFVPKKLTFIHSRRLSYTDPGSWDLHIWDQGWAVEGRSRIGGQWGLRINDYPGKFLIFSPQVRADYPTREGVGRIVGFWSALKIMGARGAAQYVERYAKPWAIATYTTTSSGTPRAAEASSQNNDVGAANAALRALGTGSLAGAIIPDSIKIQLQQVTGSRSNIGHKDWIAICNAEMSKGVLGQTDTTDGTGSGSRARAEVMKTGANQIARSDVMLIADCFQQQLVDWICRINWPNEFDLRPKIAFVVDPEPDPYGVVKLAAMFASAGAPVDADEIAKTVGVKLVNPHDKNARKLVPVKPISPEYLNPDLFEQPEGGMSPDGKPLSPPSGDSGTNDTEDDQQTEDSKDSPSDSEGTDDGETDNEE